MIRLFPRIPGSRIRRNRRARRLACEPLEARQLLSTFTVNEYNVDSATTVGSLRWALAQANGSPGNNTVTFDPSVFNVPRTITLTAGPLGIWDEGNVTVSGPGANMLTVNANRATEVFWEFYNSHATLSGMTITGGLAAGGPGGGVYAQGGQLTLKNVTISGNTASEGGGLAVGGNCSLTLTDVTVSGNSSTDGGGISILDSSATLTNVVISGNSATYGGGLSTGSSQGASNVTLTDVTVSGNSASDKGGGLYNQAGTMSLTGVTFSGNSAASGGGAYFRYGSESLSNVSVSGNTASDSGGGLFSKYSTPTLSNVTVSDNSARFGGGLLIMGGTATVTGGAVTGNTASDSGGGLYDNMCFRQGSTMSLTGVNVSGNSASESYGGGLRILGGAATLSGVTVSGNSAPVGGGLSIYNSATILSNVTVSGNTAAEGGGGLCFDLGSATLTGGTVSGNTASSVGGGGLYFKGATATLTDVTVSGNTASDFGGGLSTNGGSATLTGVTVSGNTSSNGGGLFTDGGTATLTDVTVADNSARLISGGVYIDGSAATLTDVTISGNSASQAGAPEGLAVVIGGANVWLVNTIVAGNTGPSGADYGYRLTGSGVVNSSDSLIGGNPMLAPLGDYGGPTLTMPPLPGSPAIGAGTSTPPAGDGITIPTTDQRGFAWADGVDIGAASAGNPLIVNTTVDGTGSPSGDLSLRQAVNLAEALGGNQSIGFGAAFTTGTPQTITLTSGPLVLDDAGSISINGPGPNVLTVSGNNASRVFDVTGGSATISGLSITDGSAGTGGGVYNASGNLSLTNVTISGNFALSGGGLTNVGTANLTNVTLGGNSAWIGGGLMNTGTAQLTNVTVSGNSEAATGGGLYDGNGSTTSLSNVTVSGNTASSVGGGLCLDGGTATLTDVTVSGNSANYGAGLEAESTGTAQSSLTVSGSTISGNTAAVSGGGVQVEPSNTATLTECTLTGNSAQYGGAINDNGSVSLTTCTLSANSASVNGGGLRMWGTATATLTGTTVSGNTASSAGGLYIDGGTATLTRVTVSGNTALHAGGGLCLAAGTATLTNSTVSGNAANYGAGLDVTGTAGASLTVSGSTISGNRANVSGAGVEVEPSDSATLTDCTLAGNSTEYGGAINDNGSVTLISSTISANTASVDAGGLRLWGAATAQLIDTIVAGDSGNVEIDGSYSGSHDLIGGNPLLAPLGNYGGLTQTMALLPGSPAIGGGTAQGAPGTDQRGVGRIGGRVDIGAFESRGFLVQITGGNKQSTPVGTAFPSPLSVTVSSNFGEPVAGGVVSFTAPASGASATFTGNPAVIAANGSASVSATANSRTGSYSVSASTGAGLTNFTLTNSAQSGSPDADALMITSGAVKAQLKDSNPTITPGRGGDSVPAVKGPVAVAPLSADGSILLGNGSEAGESTGQTVSEQNVAPSPSVKPQPKFVYDTTHPKMLIQTSGRNRFSFTYSKNVSQKKSTNLLN